MMTLYCAVCGVLKPIREFHRDSGSPHGHKETCKACRSEQDRERRSDIQPEQKTVEAERSRRRRAAARSMNWDRVQQLLVEALLGFPPGAGAQDIGKQIDEMLAGAASKPLPRGGAPLAWDVAVDLRDVIRRTEGGALAVECALACERFDVVTHVLIPQAECAVAWAGREYTPRKLRKEAASLLNSYHAERRVLEKRIASLRQRAGYTRAMEHIARRFYALGVR